jgi:hypothetical protein
LVRTHNYPGFIDTVSPTSGSPREIKRIISLTVIEKAMGEGIGVPIVADDFAFIVYSMGRCEYGSGKGNLLRDML